MTDPFNRGDSSPSLAEVEIHSCLLWVWTPALASGHVSVLDEGFFLWFLETKQMFNEIVYVFCFVFFPHLPGEGC